MSASGVARCQPGLGRCLFLGCCVLFLCVRPGARRCALSLSAVAPGPSPSWPVGAFLPLRCAAPRCPVPVGACLLPWAPPRPLAGVSLPSPCPSLALALSLPGVVVVVWGGVLRGADGLCLGSSGSEPPAEGFGGVRAAEALDRVPGEGLPCRLWHDGLQGRLVGVCGGAGANLLDNVHHVHPFLHSRSPDPLQPAGELPQGGSRPPGEVGGGLGDGGLQARGPGAAVTGAWGGGCGLRFEV